MDNNDKHPPVDNSARDRALRLIKYLQELAALRTKTIRDVETYENLLWLHEIPNEKGCFTQAWGINEDIGTDIWVEVQKSDEPALPKIPKTCEAWVNREKLTNTEDLPKLFSTITVQVEVQSPEEGPPQSSYEERKLEDYPEVEQDWNRYLEEQWKLWAELHRRWREVQRVYTTLFTIHQGQQRLGEEYELVLGMGLLIWRTPSGHSVRRHLISARASLNFEAKLGKFTVVPEPDGTKLSAELDMLDAEEQPLYAQQSATKGLHSASDDPWDRTSVDTVLHELAKALNPLGEYHPASLKFQQSRAENKLIVEFAPALIFRKRSLKGLQEILNKMRIQINEGGEIPPEFLDLAEGEISPGRSEPEQSNANSADELVGDPTIYFPKPSNEEQRRIIKTLQTTNGVLVQGPPGTGKSHTIANLICHLLAMGQRVLVTAQTPRALEVLQNHLPENLRPLCISLLGSGNKEQRALESSVSGILMREANRNESSNASQFTTLREKLHQLRKEKAEIDFRLRSVRESETYAQTILSGAYQGTAAKIARQLNQESAEYDWLTDPIRYDQEMPIALNDLEKLRAELIIFTPELETELGLSMPRTESDLINVQRFQELVQQEIENKNRLEKNQELLASQMGQTIRQAEIQQVHRMTEAMESLIAEVQSIKARPMSWIEPAVTDMLSDDDRPWKELHRVSEEILIGLSVRADSVDRQQLNTINNLDRRKLLNDAKALKQYLDQGGKIRWPWIFNNKVVKKNQTLIKDVCIDGNFCDSPDALEKLIEYLSVEQTIEFGWNMWKGKAARGEGSFLLQVAKLEELLEALTRVVGLYDLLENAKSLVRQVPGITEPVWHNLDSFRKFVDTSRLVISKHNLESIQKELTRHVSKIQELTRDESWHPLTQKALNCIRSRDLESYERIVHQILEFQQLAERLVWTKKILSQLAQTAPKFAEEFKATSQDPIWASRIYSIEKAWDWARANSWLRGFLNAEDIPSLEHRAKQIDEDEKDTLANLATIQAWKFCFTRLNKERQRHLIGWQQAIKKIGKGTGKGAPKHRRDAQHHLNKCKEAIPAWVMPLHRLWETIEPSPGMFDIIIVDEASQCGPDSLPLAYLGKKLVVVGDDQQISPEAVGIGVNTRQRLIQEYLHGFEHADSFDMESSLFAHGRRRFENRIVLREHFRCMPEIIRFSNDLCYHDTPLIPLRQYPPERLEPLKIIHVPSGYREGDGGKAINRPEAEALVRQVIQCCQDNKYIGKTMGVIVLQGEAQAHLIETMLVEELGAEEMEERKLICGNPYHFQGDERQIMFLSMVAAPNQRIGAFTKATDQRRFNVAASRAEEQMWLFHTATRNDLSDTCLRKRLLEFFQNPSSQISQALGEEAEQLRERAYSANRQIEKPPKPFDSWFEIDVCLAIAARGYRIVPQYPIAGKFIDLVVEGNESQLAIECDGDHWHGLAQYEADTERQRKLERAGWKFCRIRECLFNANPEAALEDLWNHLRQLKIFPVGFTGVDPAETPRYKEKPSNETPEDKVDGIPSVTGHTIKAKLHEGNLVESQSIQSNVLDTEHIPPVVEPSTSPPLESELSEIGKFLKILKRPLGPKQFGNTVQVPSGLVATAIINQLKAEGLWPTVKVRGDQTEIRVGR